MKKIIALLLALVMVLALVACGTAEPAADDTADDAAADDTAAADDAAEEETEESASADEPYTIVWYAGGTAQTDMSMVQEEVANYINENYDMNIALDIVQTPYGDMQQKMATVLSSGEKWDLCFTSSWSNNYVQNRSNGAYLALNDYLEKDAPELYELIGNYWDAVTTDGNIYAVPNLQLEYYYDFVSIPTQWVNMYNEANPDNQLVQENIEEPDDLNDFLYWAKENVIDTGVTLNGVAPSYAWWGGINYFGLESTGVNLIYFECGDETGTVKTPFDFEGYMAAMKTQAQWYNDGLIQSDIATVTDRATTDLSTLQWMTYTHPTFKPGEDANQYAYWGLDQDAEELTFFTFGEPWAATNSVIATLTAVNANCEDPDTVVKFLNIINTDATAFNMLCFGIEGYHYEVVDGCVQTSTENTGYDPNNDWGFGNQFLAVPRQGQSPDVWEVTAEMNASCGTSAVMGFLADAANVSTQVANVSVVVEQYGKYFEYGAVEGTPEDWDAFVEQYKTAAYDAGLQEIVDEIQGQVDAWLAAK